MAACAWDARAETAVQPNTPPYRTGALAVLAVARMAYCAAMSARAYDLAPARWHRLPNLWLGRAPPSFPFPTFFPNHWSMLRDSSFTEPSSKQCRCNDVSTSRRPKSKNVRGGLYIVRGMHLAACWRPPHAVDGCTNRQAICTAETPSECSNRHARWNFAMKLADGPQ